MKKGFTLFELLVVIAIIGILSSVVLASLNTARDKGANAAAKANLNNARAQAELYYDTAKNYTTVCDSGTSNISALVEAAESSSGNTAVCVDLASAWAAEIPLKASEGYYCADSSGNATTTAASSIAADTDVLCGPGTGL